MSEIPKADRMLSVEQALEKVLGSTTTLDAVECPLLDSLGLVLSDDITSGVDVPPAPSAVMDGFAVRAADTTGASRQSPRLLRVVGTVAAGYAPACRVEPGTAVRIMTGAPLPAGADAVVRFEDTDEPDRRGAHKEIGILKEAEAGLFIRRAGDDVIKGEKVLAAGTVLRPPEIGVLASQGLASVRVIRRPKVAVLSTGDELVEVGRPPQPGKLYNSNAYGLAASVIRFGGTPMVLGIARDNEASIIQKLEQAAGADFVITAGGTSAGDYDLVKDVLSKKGELIFTAVNMKPGRSLAFGLLKMSDKAGAARDIPHLGLPGNPTSAMVAAELFLRPAILKMLGRKNLARPAVLAVVEEGKENEGRSRLFYRAIVTRRDGTYSARLTGPRGTGVLTSMSRANGLAVIPEDRNRVEKGDIVSVMMLDWDDAVF